MIPARSPICSRGAEPVVRQFLRYVLTGGAAAVVDLGGFWLLFRLGMPVIPAAMASWFVAALANYALSSRFVFQSARSLNGGFKFVAGALIGFVLNVCITAVCARGLGIYPPAAKVIGIGGAFIFNFAINRFWVFR